MVDLPREILNEILHHLRQDWTAHQTTLSNSGLQIALTCTWLYEELQPELEAKQNAILAKAIDENDLPSSSSFHSPKSLLLIYGDIGDGWGRLLLSECLAFKAAHTDAKAARYPRGIRRYELNIPILRSADTDLLWCLKRFISMMPEQPILEPAFQLTLRKVDEVIEQDAGKRARWARSFCSMLDAAILRKGSALTVTFRGFEDTSEDDTLRSFFATQQLEEPELDPVGVTETLLSRLQNLLSRRRVHRPGAPVTISGPLFNSELYTYTGHIMRRSPDSKELSINTCTATHRVWDIILPTWTLPHLRNLTLKYVNIPLTSLLVFLEAHPTLRHLFFTHWQRPTDDNTTPISDARPALRISIKFLTGDPKFLVALLDSNIELPSLSNLTVRCLRDSSFEYRNPDHWTDLTLVLVLLGRRQAAMKVKSPLHLHLLLPHCSSFLGWLHGVQPPYSQPHRPDGSRRPTGGIKSFLKLTQRRQPTNIPQTLLPESLRSLHCVTSLYLDTHPVYIDTPVRSVSPKEVAAFVSLLPSIQSAKIEVLFTGGQLNLNRAARQDAELWEGLGEVWTGARRLKTMEIRDTGVVPWTTWTWRRRWAQPRVTEQFTIGSRS